MFTGCFCGGKKDRLSELPQDILQHIILLLQTTSLKSIASFAMTSKVCLGACHSSPYLTFAHCSNDNASLDKKKKQDFVKRVDQCLHRMISIEHSIICFRLLIAFENFPIWENFHILSRWMDMVFALNVRVIHLDFVTNCVTLPVSLFSGVSFLQELSIEGCELKQCDNAVQESDIVLLPSLRLFTLKLCTTTSAVVEAVLQGCPLLEHLVLIGNRYVKSIEFPRLLNLKTLVFNNPSTEKIDVEVPSLTAFSCWTIMPHFNVAYWFLLSELSLFRSDGLNDNILQYILSQLTNLEFITIGYFKKLENPLIISSSILYIQLINCGISGVIHFDCPNLRTFTCHAHEIPRIKQQGTCSSDWKLDLHLEYYYSNEINLLVELRKLISDTNIRLSSFHIEAHDMLPEKRMWKDQAFAHPIKIKYLKIDICIIHNSPQEMLNDFLWILHPQYIVLTREDYSKNLSSIMTKMKNTRAMFVCSCCKVGKLRNCWHHSLGVVKLFWFKVDDKYLGVDSLPMNWEVKSQPERTATLSVCYKLTWQ